MRVYVLRRQQEHNFLYTYSAIAISYYMQRRDCSAYAFCALHIRINVRVYNNATYRINFYAFRSVSTILCNTVRKRGIRVTLTQLFAFQRRRVVDSTVVRICTV